MFDLFDSNGGGSIDADELDEALRSAEVNVTKEEINEVLSSMDKDGRGMLFFRLQKFTLVLVYSGITLKKFWRIWRFGLKV